MTPEQIGRQGLSVVPRYARIDVIGGALMVFISALIWFGAIELNVGTLANFGSGAMPKGLALVLLVAGGAVLLQGLVQSDAAAERFDIAVRPMVTVVVAILLFGLFVRGTNLVILSTPQLGLLIVGPLTVFVAGCATPQLDVKALLVLCFGLTAAMLIVFVDLLGVAVPIYPTALQDAIALSFDPDTAVRAAYVAYAVVATLLYMAFFGIPEQRGG
jgi:hypothetical protein